MFERNRVDNANDPAVAVEITLEGGDVVAGLALLPKSKAVHKLLDGEEKFLFVSAFDGEGVFVPKTDIKALRVMTTHRPRALHLATPDATGFDPCQVLGIDKDSAWDEVRAAYHRMTKRYHPDRYAGVELPSEVQGYLEAMAKQVNAAFRALRSRAGGKAA